MIYDDDHYAHVEAYHTLNVIDWTLAILATPTYDDHVLTWLTLVVAAVRDYDPEVPCA